MYEVSLLWPPQNLSKSLSARSQWGKHPTSITVRLYSFGRGSQPSAYDVGTDVAVSLPSDKLRSLSLLKEILNKVSFKLFQKALYIGNISLPKFHLQSELDRATFCTLCCAN
jgi:hypothetical protein